MEKDSVYKSACEFVCVFLLCVQGSYHISADNIPIPIASLPQLTQRHEVTGVIKRLDSTIMWLCVSIVTYSCCHEEEGVMTTLFRNLYK